MKINQYQFDRICSQTEHEFGKIRKGEEDQYTLFFFPLEGNLLKVHRNNPASNSRRLLEAISLVLFQIKSNLTGEEYDLDSFRSEDNEKLAHALLMTFDPFTNEELRAALGQEALNALEDKDTLRKYYAIPVMCILRIWESVETFGKHLGADGYFEFIEQHMGTEVAYDEEFQYAVVLPDTEN